MTIRILKMNDGSVSITRGSTVIEIANFSSLSRETQKILLETAIDKLFGL